MNSEDIRVAAAKVLAVWLAGLTSLQISDWLGLLMCLYTALQIYVIVRDRIVRKKAEK